MKFVIFTVFLMIAMAAAAVLQAGQQQADLSKLECMPLSLPCRQTSDCCRNLECVKHANICVPQTNPDPEDSRPEGPKMPYAGCKPPGSPCTHSSECCGPECVLHANVCV